MAIDKIPSAGIDSGGVAPSNLSTGAPSWDSSGNLTAAGTITATNVFGQSQTWQNVTASRTITTTYYNTTARPITVVIQFSYNGTPANLGQLTVGGVLITFGQTNSAYINAASGTAIVPPGASYVFSATSGSLAIGAWLELR